MHQAAGLLGSRCACCNSVRGIQHVAMEVVAQAVLEAAQLSVVTMCLMSGVIMLLLGMGFLDARKRARAAHGHRVVCLGKTCTAGLARCQVGTFKV